jgi:hypothetical protein
MSKKHFTTRKAALRPVTKTICVTLAEEDWRRLRISAAENNLSESGQVRLILQTVIVAEAVGRIFASSDAR